MKISIITPCLNAETYITDTIESILFQKGNFEIEYIIVDGASTDHTCEIAGQYLDNLNRGNFPFYCKGISARLSSEKDNGMYDALVKGLKQVTGDVVAYLNADDFYQPNAFAVLTELFDTHPGLNWITGVPTFYNRQGIIIESDWPVIYDNRFIRQGMYNNKALPYIQQESVFFRSSLLDSIDFDRLKTFRYAGDSYLWNCFSKKYPLFILSAVLSGYRMRPGNLAVSSGGSYMDEMNSLHETLSLTDEEYNYLFFLHYSWWKESKLVKETGNGRYISWDTVLHRWKTDGLEYDPGYRLPYTESFSFYMEGKPPGYGKEYIVKYLIPEA